MSYQYNFNRKYNYFRKNFQKKSLSGGVRDKTLPAKEAWALKYIDLAKRYEWTINNVDLDEANELKLRAIKKYWKHADQVQIEPDWLYNLISALSSFIWYLHREYDNEKVTNNMNVRQNIKSK